MNSVFLKLGYYIDSVRYHAKDEQINVLSIQNPDGTPRWVWNANNKQPIFLKFYNVGSKRARFFSLAIQLVFIFNLQRLFFKKSRYFFSKQSNPAFDCNDNWALFMGTIGPNNKAILFANKSFYKVANGENSHQLIQNEYLQLQKIIHKNGLSFVVPQSKLITKSVLQLSDISTSGKRVSTLSPQHLNVLLELYRTQSITTTIRDWALFQNLKTELKLIKDSRLPCNMLRKIAILIDNIKDEESIELSIAHGDFTQWNMYQTMDGLYIYDWELSSDSKPKGFDYFHFIIQNDVLVEHKCWEEIYRNILNSSGELFNRDTNELKKYLRLYLLVNVVHYLNVYAKQKEWHIQIEWLFQAWNQGLSLLLENNFTPRELLIMDLFDSIQNKDYAALKFQNALPESLLLDSDIDLVVDKKMNQSMLRFLQKHSSVKKVSTIQKSFMNTVQVILKNGEILSLDLIWQLKRKKIQILDAANLIKNAIANQFGIKSASEVDTAKFICLFYALNKATIPSKYLSYSRVFAGSNDWQDLLYSRYFKNPESSPQSLLMFVKKQPINKGLSGVSNSLLYFLDTIKGLLNNKGFTITFSGVDGAGKSTVIENIARRIEKRLRKKVIVLRHRPSILPILSVWSKGKERAHFNSVAHLPRQGKNKNIISSLLRFSYYYTDYLLGQFFVYFRYIIRGYIVLYDRYYFDFINDAKRSNIVLPKPISLFGYRFLFKPKFNFFLFADADTILKRKKELSHSTINELTKSYKSLFRQLQSRSHSSVYLAIKNDDLEITLNRVLNTINLN
jgi:thymidylate kinase